MRVSFLIGALLFTSCYQARSQKTTPLVFDQLMWADEFEGEFLDTTQWEFKTGAHGWGNREWQDYTRGDNVEVKDGILSITAKKMGPGQRAGDYTSSRIVSKRTFTYGRMEIRAKMPEFRGNGLWPAIWMLGENISEVGWPACGELDIMEYVSYTPGTVYHAVHTEANNHVKQTEISSGPIKLPEIESSFHTYGLIWTSTELRFYIDDQENPNLIFTRPKEFDTSTWPFDHPFYFILNVAVGGNWGGQMGVDDTIFPSKMEVDYIRVYQ